MDTHGHGTHCAGIIYAKPNGGGDIGAGVTSYTNGKVNTFTFLFKYTSATYMYRKEIRCLPFHLYSW